MIIASNVDKRGARGVDGRWFRGFLAGGWLHGGECPKCEVDEVAMTGTCDGIASSARSDAHAFKYSRLGSVFVSHQFRDSTDSVGRDSDNGSVMARGNITVKTSRPNLPLQVTV